MAIPLCVLLWARDGKDDALTGYEDAVLALVSDHGGKVVSRVRRLDAGVADEPLEVQVIEFPDEAALAAYTNDPARLAMAGAREAAVARTEIIRVRQLAAPYR